MVPTPPKKLGPDGKPQPPPGALLRIELAIENVLFASRWLLAPFFFGLALSILILLFKFVMEVIHLVSVAFTTSGTQLVAEILSLVDLTLTASLLIIVVFSGYENFVSRIDHSQHRDWPAWMGSIDFTGLKLKVLSSIVAISAVQLLKLFMALPAASDRELWWSAGIHLIFVISTVLLALSDWIVNKTGHGPSDEAAAASLAEPSPRNTSSGDPHAR